MSQTFQHISPEPYSFEPDLLRDLYKKLLTPRLIEEQMLLLLRKGQISKWFSGIGQEAVAVGATAALQEQELIFPLHRHVGVFTTRHVSLERLFAQFQGKASGFTQGRDRSFHFGAPEYNIIGMISHLGPQLALASGVALAARLNDVPQVTLAFSGEGGTSEGDFHEALNVAAVWDLPVIFLVENNGYALSTPPHEQFRCHAIVDKAKGYGIEGVQIDGNDVLAVYAAISDIAASLRERPRPILVEAATFRMRGHEEASGIKYVPKELLEEWGKKDPIKRYEDQLLSRGLVEKVWLEEVREAIQEEIEAAFAVASAESDIFSSEVKEEAEVFAPSVPRVENLSHTSTREMRFVDAIADAHSVAMEHYPELVIMGQDVADYGGVFKVTEGLMERFGADRVRNTPLCESAIVGIGLGLAIAGKKSIVEMQFSDFASCGFNQIVNNLAKVYYRWGQTADVVIRMPAGGGVGAGPFHSQTMEAWFMHTPGLKIAYPAFPQDAKALLLKSVEDANPVLFFEHKKLYRSISGPVSEGFSTLDFGKARVVREGSEITVVAYGVAVHWALEMCEELDDIAIEVIDLRTLVPLDWETIRQSLEKTGRGVVVHEATYTAGAGAEIAARISEHYFELLDAPLGRVASLDTPVPFAGPLEEQFQGRDRLREAILATVLY